MAWRAGLGVGFGCTHGSLRHAETNRGSPPTTAAAERKELLPASHIPVMTRHVTSSARQHQETAAARPVARK